MSDLIVVGFDGPKTAEQALLKLGTLKKEHLVDLDDAVVVVRDDSGAIKVQQSYNLTAAGAATGALSGSLWGSLVGLLFLNPLAGFLVGGAVGAGTGALGGSLSDYGIDDDFVQSLGSTIPSDSSALFILVRKVQPEKVLAEFSDQKGRVLHTSLSPEQESKLRAALA